MGGSKAGALHPPSPVTVSESVLGGGMCSFHSSFFGKWMDGRYFI